MTFIPFLTGIFMKIYDDIEDNELSIDPKYMEVLKVLIVCFATLWCYLNTDILIILIFISITCYFVKEIDTLFWKACMLIPIITALFNFNSIKFVSVTNLIEKVVYISLCLIAIVIESWAIPEEFSIFKYLVRIVHTVIILPLILFLAQSLSSYDLIYQFSIFGLGYDIPYLLLHFNKFYVEQGIRHSLMSPKLATT